MTKPHRTPLNVVLAVLLVVVSLLLWLVWPAEAHRYLHARLSKQPQLATGYVQALYENPAAAGPTDVAMLQSGIIQVSSSDVYAAEDERLEQSPAGDRVVLMGDSVTYGWRNSDTVFARPPYVNRGIGGNGSVSILLRFQQDVVRLHPRTVVLLAGTNDVEGVNGQHPAGWTEDNLRSMTDIARENDIQVVVCSLPPMELWPYKWTKPTAAMNDKLLEINAWLKRYAAERHLPFADFHSVLADGQGHMRVGMSDDGLHPNKRGYAALAPVLSAAMAQLKPPSAERTGSASLPH